MKISNKVQNNEGLYNVLPQTPFTETDNVFPEYWLLKDEAVGLIIQSTFMDDRCIDKESPAKINGIAEKFLRELCKQNEVFFKDLHAYWKCSWNVFNHPHFHITVLLRGIHRSKPQLLIMAKTAKRIWHEQNAAICECQVFDKEKGTKEKVHSYALRNNDGIHNRIGMTPRLNRLLLKRSNLWSHETNLKEPQNEPIQLFQKSFSEPRRGSNSFTNPPAQTLPICEVKRLFVPKSTSRNGFKKGKIRGLWEKMTHLWLKIRPFG
jgi:hypothetical protein